MELSEHDLRAVPALGRSLGDVDQGVREAAAASLGRIGGDEALRLLCAALRSKDLPTCAAAAQALGQLGDLRAIPPLRDALRGCFTARSARVQRSLGWLLVSILSTGYLAWCLLMPMMKELRFLILVAPFAGQVCAVYVVRRRRHSRQCATISEALLSIGERHPGPELQAMATELRVTGSDFIIQEKRTRDIVRKVADRIESLSARSRELPIVAAAPEPALESLPVASCGSGDGRAISTV